MMREGYNTPWGPVQQAEVLGPGIVQVSTAGHGGIWLDRDHAQRMRKEVPNPNNWLGSFTWWEEDCDAVLPLTVFYDELSLDIEMIPKERLEEAWKDMKPDSYQEWCRKGEVLVLDTGGE